MKKIIGIIVGVVVIGIGLLLYARYADITPKPIEKIEEEITEASFVCGRDTFIERPLPPHCNHDELQKNIVITVQKVV